MLAFWLCAIINVVFYQKEQLTQVASLSTEEELSKTWRICTKVKDSLENGSRLENLSWRLWHLHKLHSCPSRPSSGLKTDALQRVTRTLQLDGFESTEAASKDSAAEAQKAASKQAVTENAAVPSSAKKDQAAKVQNDQKLSASCDNSLLADNIRDDMSPAPTSVNTQEHKIHFDDLFSFPATAVFGGDLNFEDDLLPRIEIPFSESLFQQTHNYSDAFINDDVYLNAFQRTTSGDIMLATGNSMSANPSLVSNAPGTGINYSQSFNGRASFSTRQVLPQEASFLPNTVTATNIQKAHQIHDMLPDTMKHNPNVHIVAPTRDGQPGQILLLPDFFSETTANQNKSSDQMNPPAQKRLSVSVPYAAAAASATDEDLQCANCQTRSTPLWRRSETRTLCNACGLYFKLHKQDRPQEMISSSVSLKRKAGKDGVIPEGFDEKPQCGNCQTMNTPLWRRVPDDTDPSVIRILCNACGLYRKMHGKDRPLSMKTSDSFRRRPRGKVNHTPAPYMESAGLNLVSVGVTRDRSEIQQNLTGLAESGQFGVLPPPPQKKKAKRTKTGGTSSTSSSSGSAGGLLPTVAPVRDHRPLERRSAEHIYDQGVLNLSELPVEILPVNPTFAYPLHQDEDADSAIRSIL